MLQAESYKTHLPAELYEEIESLISTYQQLQREAAGISGTADVPDSSEQLQDVLQHTENATNTIIDATTEMMDLIASETLLTSEQKNAGSDQGMKILEACNFQDVSGQRIKKVLTNLAVLEEKLAHLEQLTHRYGKEGGDAPQEAHSEKTFEESLKNGPQLAEEAPTQEDIDKLFDSF